MTSKWILCPVCGNKTRNRLREDNQENHYYPITVTATDNHGNSKIVNQADLEFGESLRLYVKEETKPTISVIFPTDMLL